VDMVGRTISQKKNDNCLALGMEIPPEKGEKGINGGAKKNGRELSLLNSFLRGESKKSGGGHFLKEALLEMIEWMWSFYIGGRVPSTFLGRGPFCGCVGSPSFLLRV